jgi:hypothetical protein
MRNLDVAEMFGDPADFAIESGVELDRHTPATVWGHMCVWCRGVALGDIDDRYCCLYGAYAGFACLAVNLGNLWAEELARLDYMAAWNFLDGLLYGCRDDVIVEDDRTFAECRRDALRWGHFNFLTNWGEQFDGCKSFIMCPPTGSAIVLSRCLPDRGALVSPQNVVEASTGFASWFEVESRRLGVPCHRQP